MFTDTYTVFQVTTYCFPIDPEDTIINTAGMVQCQGSIVGAVVCPFKGHFS